MKACFLLALLTFFFFGGVPAQNNLLQSFDLTNEDNFALWWYGAVINAARVEGLSPAATSRQLAVLSLALFEVANTYEASYNNLISERTLTGTDLSVDASLAAAGLLITNRSFPDQENVFTLIYKTQIGILRRPRNGLISRNLQNSIRLGRAIAEDVWDNRTNDGYSVLNDTVVLPANPGRGQWRPTLPAFQAPLNPAWDTVLPFVLTSNAQFLPPPPFSIDAPRVIGDLAEIFTKGRDNSFGPDKRTILESYAATFFAHEFPGEKTFPSLFFEVAAGIAQQAGLDRVRATRLLSLTGLVLADTMISVWHAKYLYNYWRPITALTEDSRSNRPFDPSWLPQLPTPPYPSYPSAHAACAAAATTIWTNFFGSDEHRFTVSSDTIPGLHPTYFKFSQFADDNAYGRVYGGVQLRFSVDAGFVLGQNVATYVWDTALTTAS